MPHLDAQLKKIVDGTASDLHLCSGHPPFWRQNGVMARFDGDDEVLTSERIMQMLREVLPPDNYTELLEECDTDCAYAIPGLARFRVNGFKDMNGYCAVFRVIPERIPTFDELDLPNSMRDLCKLSKGLVIVTGPTGSGKSTTLAAMLNYINQTRREHVITIEDPIEFVHTSQQCLINQREVHRDTRDFARALRAALREDPDIVLVGEIRDLETMEIAIETAETGHLVFATLHTNTAIASIDRIIDRFPGERQNQIRSMLADTLKGVIAQVLCPRVGGGRVAAFEVLLVNTPVAAMIREAKTHMLGSVMQTSRALGMQSFSDELCRLVSKGLVTPEDAHTKAVDKLDLERRYEKLGLDLAFKQVAEETARVEQIAALRKQLDGLRELLTRTPDDVASLCTLAWFLATSRYDGVRDGREALRLAERANALARGKDPAVLAMLGVAHAECGAFRRAIAATRDAIKLFQKAGDSVAVATLDLRLREFEQGEPHRES